MTGMALNYADPNFLVFPPVPADSSAWAALLSLLMCVLEGETGAAVHFVLTDRLALLCISVYALLNIVGIYFVLVMIAHFGATLTTFTTSLRKGLSVVLSFVVYTKPFAWGYLLGGLLTAIGIALNMQAANIKRKAKARDATLPLTRPDDRDDAMLNKKQQPLGNKLARAAPRLTPS